MSLPTHIPQAVLDTVLDNLALLFLTAAGNPATARQAAAQLLADYNPETPEELSLAAEIISFGLHTLEALSNASSAELSLNRILRLRGSAVSLSREQHKAHRKLDQLQRARRQPQSPETRPAVETAPAPGPAPARTEATPASPHPAEKMTWTQNFQKRQLAKRMAENARKNQLKQASQLAQAARLSG